jgi:hypothetical protein
LPGRTPAVDELCRQVQAQLQAKGAEADEIDHLARVEMVDRAAGRLDQRLVRTRAVAADAGAVPVAVIFLDRPVAVVDEPEDAGAAAAGLPQAAERVAGRAAIIGCSRCPCAPRRRLCAGQGRMPRSGWRSRRYAAWDK